MLPSSLLLPHLWNFLLPLPAQDRASRFRVRFRLQSFSSKCFRFRFHKNLTASTASASTSLLSMIQLIAFSLKKSRQVYFVSYYIWLVLSTGHGMEWNGMEDDFSVFHTGNFRPFHFRSILKVFHSIFHSILNFLPFSIPYFHTKESEDWKQCNVYFAALHLCNVVSNRSWRCVNNTKMPQSVSGMPIAHGLMHRRSQDFGMGGGLNRKSHAVTLSKIFKKRDFLWDKKWNIKSWGSAFARNQDLLKRND